MSRHARASHGPGAGNFGFSLLETAIVLVIVGIILGIGTSAWLTMNDARRLTLTSNRLNAIKNCLITRVVNSQFYPDFTANYSSPSSASVDGCMVDRLDAWQREFRFLNGLEAAADGFDSDDCLLENPTLPDNHPCGANNAPVVPDTTSTALDGDGNTVDDVAFILISFGEDGNPDSATYGTPLSGVFAATMAGQPDFSVTTDDLFLIVTYPDLLAAIARSTQ